MAVVPGGNREGRWGKGGGYRPKVTYYDPAAPQEAYLETHRPRVGGILLVGGAVGLMAALVALLAG